MAKLCIIGGGPAGLATAISAAQGGIEVTLFDRGNIGDNIRCAEGFIDSIRLFGEPRAGVRFRVEQVIVEVKESYVIDGQNFNLWMIDRREWQQDLAREALELGVKIMENRPVAKDELVRLKKKYDWVVDASGVPSVSSRALGFSSWYREKGVVAGQYVLAGDFSHLDKKIKIGLETHYHGYYWIFPKGRGAGGQETANVGIGCFVGESRRETGFNIWQELERVLVKEGLAGYRRLRRIGGICPVTMPPALVIDNLILVGDAGGLTSPLHGGGIDLALLSGQLAARSMLAGRPEEYAQSLTRIIGPKLEVEWRLWELWREFSFDQVDDLLRLIVRDYSHLDWRKIVKYPRLLLRELGTVARFWNGLARGQWQQGLGWSLVRPLDEALQKVGGKRLKSN